MSLVLVAPDGRRELRTSADQLNLSLHQLKQWAIISFNLPPDHYILRYQRKLLDPSLSIRLAGLPNGARVEILSIQMLGPKEILELKTARERPVAVTLLVHGREGGLTEKFRGDTKLVTMLHHFNLFTLTEDGSTSSPVLQIGNEKVSGMAVFSSTCLYDYGLGGNAKIQVIAFESCTPQDATIHANMVNAVKPKPAELKPAEIKSEMTPIVHNQQGEVDYDMDMVVIEAPSNPTSPIPDLPEDFYTLTPAEHKYFQSSASRTVTQLKDRPLLSKSALDRVNERKVLEAHPFTRIRFRFPDHTCIERNFRTKEAVSDMMGWIRNGLSRYTVPEFSLSVGPPPRTLKPHDTLMGLKLYPAAIVNVIWIDRSGANVKTTTLLGDTRDEGHPAAKRVSSPTITPLNGSTVESDAGTKVPKWLKLHKQ